MAGSVTSQQFPWVTVSAFALFKSTWILVPWDAHPHTRISLFLCNTQWSENTAAHEIIFFIFFSVHYHTVSSFDSSCSYHTSFRYILYCKNQTFSPRFFFSAVTLASTCALCSGYQNQRIIARSKNPVAGTKVEILKIPSVTAG